jgi:hypothetical protein
VRESWPVGKADGRRMRRILLDLAAGMTGDESTPAAPVWLPLS